MWQPNLGIYRLIEQKGFGVELKLGCFGLNYGDLGLIEPDQKGSRVE